MISMKFSIWYNEKSWFLDLITLQSNKISSVYFALPKDIGSSWRPAKQEWNYYDDIKKLIITCNKLWIDTILLLNSTDDWKSAFSKKWLNKLFTYITLLISYWLKSATITNMLYIKLLKTKFPNLIIYSSVNCWLKTVEQAIYFKKLWVDILTIDRDINRDLWLIKEIGLKTWLKIQLMLNEPCIRNCPFRQAHFNAVANNNEQIFWIEFEDLTCYPMIKNNNKLFFRIPFIRPEDIKYYKDIVHIYKLVTRDASNEKIEFLLDIYSKEFFDWNIIEIFDLEKNQYLSTLNISNSKLSKLKFFDKIKNCIWDCENCKICNIFLQ